MEKQKTEKEHRKGKGVGYDLLAS
eukprot:COSAG06_NODE_59866_length_272_cov_43.208092_2_plen_23_part_01